MSAIYEKEMRLYFVTPQGYVFLAAFWSLSSYFFYLYNLRAGSTDFRALFDMLFTIVLFLLPLLTMRSFSEERRQRSDVLSLTAPVTTGDIVLGKYLAALTLYAAGMAVTPLLALYTSFRGPVDGGLLALHFGGLFMLGAALIAVGILISSLTESQIIAAVSTLAASLALMLLDTLIPSLRQPWLVAAARRLSFRMNFQSFTLGVLNFPDVFYFVSVAVLFLLFTTLVLDGRRWHRRRALASRALKVAVPVLAVLLFFSLQLTVTRASEHLNLSRDLTETRAFKLSQETKEALTELEEEVSIYVLAREDSWLSQSDYNAQVVYIMREMAKANRGIMLEFIDYTRHPDFTARFPDAEPKLGDIIVASGERYEWVETEQLFTYERQADNRPAIAQSKAEAVLLQAIGRVLQKEDKTVVFLHGHGEMRYEGFEKLLKEQGYQVLRMNPSLNALPDDADIIVSLAPMIDYEEALIESLDRHLKDRPARSLLYFADLTQQSMPNWDQYLGFWGISVGEGSVFETDESRVLQYQPFYPMADLMEIEGVTQGLRDDRPVIMPLSRPLFTHFEYKNKYAVGPYLMFGPKAGVKPQDAPENFDASMATMQGPFPAAILSSYDADGTGQRDFLKDRHLIVFSSVRALDAIFLESGAFRNSDAILQLLHAVTGGKNLLMPAAKSLGGHSLLIGRSAADRFGTLTSFGMPLIWLLVGFLIWQKRRRAV